ncbi:MAG: (2Fe-2S) ferredoxin domain-containing protein [Chloroflexi bacterium]|nr:(2Fe-2S) ferredoxin domain-containing protein [Chloroflexota bacterium]
MTENPRPKRRIVLCMGEYCNLDRRAAKLLPILQTLIDDLNTRRADDAQTPTLKLETARCLSMCGAGPNCVIYPEDIVTNGLSEDKLRRMVATHLES